MSKDTPEQMPELPDSMFRGGFLSVAAPDNANRPTSAVKLTLPYSLVEKLGDDLAEACEILQKKGAVHEAERKKVHTGTSY